VWGSRLCFDVADDETTIDRIVEWLEERGILHCAFFTFASYGKPHIFTILLPIKNDVEAIYLALWPECIQIIRTDEIGRLPCETI